MNYIKTLVALVILIGLLYYANILDKRPEETPESKKADLVKDFPFDKLTNIKLKRDYDTFEIEFAKKANDEWYIQKPIETLADQSTINELINNVRTAKVDSTIEEKEITNYDDFGLGTRAISLVFKADTHELLINYGNKNPNGTLGYTKVNNSKSISLVESRLINDANKSFSEYRDKKVANFNVYAITSFEISYPASNETYLFKKEHDFWYQIVNNDKLRVNSNLIDDMLTQINNVRAQSFIETFSGEYNEPSVQSGTGEIVLNFSTSNTAETAINIIIGRNHPTKTTNCFLKTNYKKELLLVDSSIKNTLTKSKNDFLPKTCIDFKPNNVETITLIPPTTDAVTLKKTGSDWKIEKRGTKEVNIMADTPKVEDLLQKIKRTEVTYVLEKPTEQTFLEHFANHGTYEIRLGLTFSGRTESVFLVSKDYENQPYVRCDEPDRYYRLMKNEIDEIIKVSNDILSKQN